MPCHSSSAVDAAAASAAAQGRTGVKPGALGGKVGAMPREELFEGYGFSPQLLGAVTLRLTARALTDAQRNRVASSCEGVRGSASEAASAMKPTSEAGAPDTGRVMLGSAARPFALSESKKGCHSGGTSPQHRQTKKSLR